MVIDSFSFSVTPRKKKEMCGIAKPVSDISISSTDSQKESTEYTKSIQSRLQSPIESHFAITPTTDSKTSSPANGFTSVESGQLLCEELDSLNVTNKRNDTHESKESIVSDDFVPIHSTASIENLKHSSKDSIIDELVQIHSPIKSNKKVEAQLNDLLSPAEETISMFTQLTDKLTEITAEGDSGVDTAHNNSDDETCKPEVSLV